MKALWNNGNRSHSHGTPHSKRRDSSTALLWARQDWAGHDKNGDCYSNGCFCKQKLIIWSNILSSEVSVSCLATVINALWGYVVQTVRDTCYAFSYPVTPLCNFLCPALKWCNKHIKQDSLEVFYVVWKHGKVERRRRYLSHCRKCG